MFNDSFLHWPEGRRALLGARRGLGAVFRVHGYAVGCCDGRCDVLWLCHINNFVVHAYGLYGVTVCTYYSVAIHAVAALCGDTAGDRATDESVRSSPPKRRADPRSPTSSSSASELVTVGLASWPLLAKMLRLAACREGVGRGGGSGRPGASQVGGGGRKRSDYEKCNASTARHAGWPPRCTDTHPVLVHARMISHATPHKVHSGSTHGDRGTDRCGGGAPVACR